MVPSQKLISVVQSIFMCGVGQALLVVQSSVRLFEPILLDQLCSFAL